MNYECKTIPGYENYECDIFGNVWSLNYNKTKKRRKLKAAIDRNGYLYLNLCKNNKRRTQRVHRLVMLTFCGASDLQVNHIDGNKKNNNLLNLEYCTSSENILHAFRIGLKKMPKGENHPSNKLTKKEVIEIKTALLKPYWGINSDLGRKYRVNPATIRSIKSGRTWAHVKIN
jgi:hypothetical protein